MGSRISGAVKKIAGLIPSGVKEFLGIHSPSRVLMELGVYTGQGFANGIQSTIGSVRGAANDMAGAAIPSLAYQTPSLAGNAFVSSVPDRSQQSAQGSSQKVSVRIPVIIDGREVAHATVDDIDELLKFKAARTSRF
jgi:hypothetical protein